MVNREMFPAPFLDLPQRAQQFVRIGIVARPRFWIDVPQRKDLERAILFAADDAAGFIRRIPPRLCDQLFESLV